MKLKYSPEENRYYWEAFTYNMGLTEISQLFETERAAMQSQEKGELRWAVIKEIEREKSFQSETILDGKMSKIYRILAECGVPIRKQLEIHQEITEMLNAMECSGR